MNESATGWVEHYEKVDDDFVLFAVEARDYCERLARVIDIDSQGTVLDFGCGFGYVTALLAPRVRQLYVWDQARNMRERCLRRVAGHTNVALLDLPNGVQRPMTLDLIIVNSVIQYMTAAEFDAWLQRWRALLDARGQLLISDIIPPDSAFLREVVDSLAFATRHGFLLKSLRMAAALFGRYVRARSSSPMLRLTREQVSAAARKHGYEVEFLPGNLTYRGNRTTARLRPVGKTQR